MNINLSPPSSVEISVMLNAMVLRHRENFTSNQKITEKKFLLTLVTHKIQNFARDTKAENCNTSPLCSLNVSSLRRT
jgi:hypothetical protein